MINTYIDISTGHLKQRTMNLLSSMDTTARYKAGWPAMTVAPYDHGAFVTVPPLEELEVFAQMHALPTDLAAVLSLAFSRGATLVRFDADGDLINLPHYEW